MRKFKKYDFIFKIAIILSPKIGFLFIVFRNSHVVIIFIKSSYIKYLTWLK